MKFWSNSFTSSLVAIRLLPVVYASAAALQDDSCPSTFSIVYVNVIEQDVLCPVYISTYIASNTQLVIGDNCTLDIKNAPTKLVTTILATSIETTTICRDDGAVWTSDSLFQGLATGLKYAMPAFDTRLPAIGPGGVESRILTSTTILPVGAPAFTSTMPGFGVAMPTVIIGQPAPSIVTSVSALPMGAIGFTSTIPAVGNAVPTVVIGKPAPSVITSISALPMGAPGFTSTMPGFGTAVPTVIIGQPAPSIVTSISALPVGAAGFTSTIPAVGNAVPTVVIGKPAVPTAVIGEPGSNSVIPFVSSATHYSFGSILLIFMFSLHLLC